MRRVKTKHRNAGRRKMVREATDMAVDYMLCLCYVSMRDEFQLSLDQCRAWKTRMDRYAGYIAEGTISFDDVKRDLRKAGFEV